MKRFIVLMAAVALLAPPMVAQADDTTFFTSIQTGGYGNGKGESVVTLDSSTIVAAIGAEVVPSIYCDGAQCDPARPALLEIQQDDDWVTWESAQLADFESLDKELTPTGTVSVRAVLPAYGDLPEMVGNTWTIRFLPYTRVRVSGDALIKPSASPIGQWQLRSTGKVITLKVQPAAAGRRVVIKDVGVVGHPVISRGRTDARGRVTLAVDLTSVSMLGVTVIPTAKQAGWTIAATGQPL